MQLAMMAAAEERQLKVSLVQNEAKTVKAKSSHSLNGALSTTACPPPDTAALKIIGPSPPPEAVSYGLVLVGGVLAEFIRTAEAVVIVSIAGVGAIAIAIVVGRVVGRTEAEW